MASVRFKRLSSSTDNTRYSAEFLRSNKGLPVFEKQRTAREMTTPTKGRPNNYPRGTDRRGDESANNQDRG
jgi:hypothetical protein